MIGTLSSMRRALRASVTVMALAVILAPAGCGPDKRTSPTVPLALRPGDSVVSVLGGTGKPAVIRVEAFADERPRKDAIGENIENQKNGITLPVFSSGPEPAEFVRQALIQNLRTSGYEVTENPIAASRIISGRLTQFWVVEGGTYNAAVNAVLEVKDAGGTSLWSGPAGGVDGTWGRSLSVENYQQTLSAATVKMLNKFFEDTGFRQTLRLP